MPITCDPREVPKRVALEESEKKRKDDVRESYIGGETRSWFNNHGLAQFLQAPLPKSHATPTC